MKASYGIDAPGVVRNFVVLSVLGLVAGLFLLQAHGLWRGFGSALMTMGVSFGITALVMLWSSLRGKFGMRDRLLNAIPWRGDEKVLDVGCGHGLMLIGAAKRLTTGRAIGIDIWQSEDQAGNSADATRRNAEAEGVADRVEIRDGDARTIPFPDSTFDVIVSSLVIHNIYNSSEREKALDEIARVLKPGGHAGICDIRHDYARGLRRRGLTILRKSTSLLFMIPTRTIIARKN